MALPVGKNYKILPCAKSLRKNMTQAERKLWYLFLRHYPVKFYKQRIIESYIVDFYCHQAQLVIELDGSQHYTPNAMQQDAQRSRILRQYGLTVMRFTNQQVENEFQNVCEAIHNYIYIQKVL